MKTLIIAAIALTAVATTITTPAQANNCLTDISKINAALPSAKITETVKARVMELQAQGTKLHEDGKHEQSVQTLAEAKVLLGIE